MNDRIREAIRQKLGDAIELPCPQFTPREAETTVLEGKARAVIGMRRAGNATFLYQCLAARLAEGVARERLVYFNFEDERLGDLEAADLGVILDEYYRSYPEFRRRERVTWCFDEIQVIAGWEKFVRRMMDSENVEVMLSGSSARMLSREVATTMRGRALETIITPFSFREFARSRGAVLPVKKRHVKTAQGHEVDFLATSVDGSTQLIQVAAEIGNVATFEREIRALQGAAAEFPAARKVLIAEGTPPRDASMPKGIELLPMWRWLIDPQRAVE